MRSSARHVAPVGPTTRRHPRRHSNDDANTPPKEASYQLVPWDPLEEEGSVPRGDEGTAVASHSTRRVSLQQPSYAWSTDAHGDTADALVDAATSTLSKDVHTPTLIHREALGGVKRRLEHCVAGNSRDWCNTVAERTNEEDPQFHMISEDELMRFTRAALAEQLTAPPRAVTALLRASSKHVERDGTKGNAATTLTHLERLAQEQSFNPAAGGGNTGGGSEPQPLPLGVENDNAAPLIEVDEDAMAVENASPFHMSRPSALTVALIFHQFESASRKDILNLELQHRLEVAMWFHQDDMDLIRRMRETQLVRLEKLVARQSEDLDEHRRVAATSLADLEQQSRKALERLRHDAVTTVVQEWSQRVCAAQAQLDRTRLVVLIETRERERRAAWMHERDVDCLNMLGAFLEGRASQRLRSSHASPPVANHETTVLAHDVRAVGEEEHAARSAVEHALSALLPTANDTEHVAHSVRELIVAAAAAEEVCPPWLPSLDIDGKPEASGDINEAGNAARRLPCVEDGGHAADALSAAEADVEVPSVRLPQQPALLPVTAPNRTVGPLAPAAASGPQSLTSLLDLLSTKKKGRAQAVVRGGDQRIVQVPPPAVALHHEATDLTTASQADKDDRRTVLSPRVSRHPSHPPVLVEDVAPTAAADIVEPLRRRPSATHQADDDATTVVPQGTAGAQRQSLRSVRADNGVTAAAANTTTASRDASLPDDQTKPIKASKQQAQPQSSPQQKSSTPQTQAPAVRFSSRVDVRPHTVFKQPSTSKPQAHHAVSSPLTRAEGGKLDKSPVRGDATSVGSLSPPVRGDQRARDAGASVAVTTAGSTLPRACRSPYTATDAQMDVEEAPSSRRSNKTTSTPTAKDGSSPPRHGVVVVRANGKKQEPSGSQINASSTAPRSGSATAATAVAGAPSSSFMRSPRASTVIGSSTQPPNSSTADSAHAFWTGVTTLVAPKFIVDADAATDSVDDSDSSVSDDCDGGDGGNTANILPTWQAKACGEASIEHEVLKHIRRHRTMVARCLRRGAAALAAPLSASSPPRSPPSTAHGSAAASIVHSTPSPSHAPFPSMHGWILKSSGLHMSWQRRYFFLNRSGRLKMSVAPDPFHSSGGPIRWETVVRVEDILRVEDDTTGGGAKLPPDHHLSNCFHVDVATHCGPRLTDVALKRLRFCCFSRKDRNGWIHGLRKARHAVRLLEESGVVEPSPMSKLLCAAHPELLADQNQLLHPTDGSFPSTSTTEDDLAG